MNAAIVRIFFLNLLASTLLCAGTATTRPPLTVVMDFESPHSEASLTALRQRLNELLHSSGVDVEVRLKADLPVNPQFGQLVVFKMKGSCSLSPALVPSFAHASGPLAAAYTSDGQILHFGEVECDRVRQSLQRLLGRDQSLKNQQAFGCALAIVIAHEVYHMLGNASRHTHTGLTKDALSPSDLLDSKLALPDGARSAIQRNSSPARLSILP